MPRTAAPAPEADRAEHHTDEREGGAADGDCDCGGESPGAQQHRQAATHPEAEGTERGQPGGPLAHAARALDSCATEGEPSAPVSVR
jgi:hypothetical protein